MNLTKRYYDQGWNAYLRGEPYDETAYLDWRDGWKDCAEATQSGLTNLKEI